MHSPSSDNVVCTAGAYGIQGDTTPSARGKQSCHSRHVSPLTAPHRCPDVSHPLLHSNDGMDPSWSDVAVSFHWNPFSNVEMMTMKRPILKRPAHTLYTVCDTLFLKGHVTVDSQCTMPHLALSVIHVCIPWPCSRRDSTKEVLFFTSLILKCAWPTGQDLER